MTVYNDDVLTPDIGQYLQSMSTTQLRNLAHNIGVRPKGNSRISVANSIASSRQGHDLSALLTNIINLVAKTKYTHYHASWLREQDNMYGAAHDRSRRRMLFLLASDYITLDKTEDLFHKLDVEVYGDTIINANVTVSLPVGYSNTYEDVSIRMKGSKPTNREVIDAIKLRGVDQYTRLTEYAALESSKAHIDVHRIGAPLRVLRHFDWSQRAHFGSVLSYPTTTKTFEAAKGIDQALEEGSARRECCYEAVRRDLGMTTDEIETALGKKASEGMTCYQMRDLYELKETSLYCVDLSERVIENQCYTVASHEERKHDDKSDKARVFVYMYANNHVYTPTEEKRAQLLNKTPDKKLVGEEEEEKKKPRKEPEIVVREEVCFDTAYLVARTMARDQHETSPAEVMKKYNAAIGEIDARINDMKEQYRVEHEGKKKTGGIKEYTKEICAQKAALRSEANAKVAEAVKRARERKVTRMYVSRDSISEEYRHLVAQGLAYASDITKDLHVTQMSVAPNIMIYANMDYTNLKSTADELKIKYINQAIPGIAREAFKQYKKKNGWESSILSNGVSQLIAQFPVSPLNLTNFAMLGDDEVVAGVDFYRQYTSLAHRGGFYTVPLMSDVETYDGEPPSADYPCLYYVETDEALLFGGNGLFDWQVVEYGLICKLITPDNIIAQIRCTASPKIDKTLTGFAEYIYKNVTKDAHRKQLMNTLIGSFARMDKYKTQKSIIVDNMEEASYYCNTAQTTHTGIKKFPDQTSGQDIYLVSARDVTMRSKTDELIRRAIVQRSRIQAHSLMMEIKEKHHILQVKTDAVLYAKKRDEPHWPVSAEMKFGATRREKIEKETRDLKIWTLAPPQVQKDTYRHTTQAWQQPLGELSETEAFDPKCLLQLNRAFIDGFAGAGKSETLMQLRDLFEAEGKRVEVCSFTHAAANLVDGVTAHNLLGVNRLGKQSDMQLKRITSGIDVVLIDEISMIPASIYMILSQLPEHVRVFGFGDFRQLPPVEGCDNGRAYNDTTMFRSLFGYNLVTLRKQWRQDASAANKLIEFYEVARECGVEATLKAGKYLPEDIKVSTYEEPYALPMRNICFTNIKRKSVNSAIMKREFKEPVGINQRIFVGYDKKPGNRYTVERFNARKAMELITYPEKYRSVFKSSRDGVDENAVLDMLKRYVANAIIDTNGNGYKQVEYYRASHGRGRWTPDESLSLFTMARPVRHIIGVDYYTDIDCANCHPAILRQLCARMDIKVPRLDEYVGNRQAIFELLAQELKTDKDMAKKLILATINGGEALYKQLSAEKCEWMRQFKEEMRTIGNAFVERYPERAAEHKRERRDKSKFEGSDIGAFVNSFMIEGEVQVLEVIVREMEQRGLLGMNGDDVVLCADGLMVPTSEKITRALLDEIEVAIRTHTKYEMQLLTKPMSPAELPADLLVRWKTPEMLEMLNPRLWDEFTHLAEGMPVIANATDKREGYCNNQTFKISKIKPEEIDLDDGEGSTVWGVSMFKFKKEFRPAYCTTAHKAQGATIREVYGIHELEKMSANGAYVALTRASDVKNVIIF